MKIDRFERTLTFIKAGMSLFRILISVAPKDCICLVKTPIYHQFMPSPGSSMTVIGSPDGLVRCG